MGGGLMRASDITVEVRNKSLVRVGQIKPEFLDLKATRRHIGLSEWTVKLPKEHEMTNELWTPGSGIIIVVRDTTFLSGPTIKPKYSASPEDPAGTVIFSGVDDNILLHDGRAWPLPSQPNAHQQTVSHDVRAGKAETVMKAYVNANIGPAAPSARRGLLAQALEIEPDLARGPMVNKSARFPRLSELLAEIAIYANLGYRVVQVGDHLEFQVYDIVDRTAFVRFDIDNGTLADEEIEVSPPELTRAIIAGQEEGADRQITLRTSQESLAAEIEWGRKIEEFIDQRQTDDPNEHAQKGDERLAEAGFTAHAVKAVPSDDGDHEYIKNWDVGDRVLVEVNDVPATTTVTEVSLIASKSAIMVGAALGDVEGFTVASALGGRVDDTQRRVERLERETSGVDDTGWVPVAFTSGFQNYADAGDPFPCQVRRIGKQVFSRGLCQKTTGGWTSGENTESIIIPEQFRPGGNLILTLATNGGTYPANSRLNTNGSWQFRIAPNSNPNYVSIAASWLID